MTPRSRTKPPPEDLPCCRDGPILLLAEGAKRRRRAPAPAGGLNQRQSGRNGPVGAWAPALECLTVRFGDRIVTPEPLLHGIPGHRHGIILPCLLLCESALGSSIKCRHECSRPQLPAAGVRRLRSAAGSRNGRTSATTRSHANACNRFRTISRQIASLGQGSVQPVCRRAGHGRTRRAP